MPADPVPIASLGVTFLALLAQAALFAFFLGKLSARISAIEARSRGLEDSSTAIAAMTATLQALKESVDDIKVTFSRRFEAVEHTVKNLMMAPPRRRALTSED